MGGTPRNYQVALSDGPLTTTPSDNFTAELTCPSKLEKCERVVTRPSFEIAHGNEQTSKIYDPITDLDCRPQWPAHQRNTAVDTVPATVLKRLEAPVCGSSAVVDAKHSSAPPSRISSLPVPSSVAVVTSPSNAGSRPESFLPNNTSSHGEMRCTERSGSTCAVPTSHASTVSSQSRTSLAEVCASARHAPCFSRNTSNSGKSSPGVRTESAVHNTTVAGCAANESTCRFDPSCTSSYRASAQTVKMAICGAAAVAEAPSPYMKTVITSAAKRGVSASSRVNATVKVARTTRGVAGTRALTSSPEQQAPRQSPRQSPPVAGAGTQEYAPPSQVPPRLVSSPGTPALKTALPPAAASTEVACAVASPSLPTTIARRLLQPAVSPPVDDGEQLCAASTNQTLPADRCSFAIVSDAVAYKSGGKDKNNATDNSSELSPALVIPSEPVDPVAAVVQPTATVSLSEESRADLVLCSSSVASSQRRELLQDLRKVEQPYLSQTNEYVQNWTSTGYASDFLRSAEGGSALETVVTQLHDVTTETGLSCREGEEGACTVPWTRSQQGPQARRTAGTSQPVASRMQHLLSCAGASHPRTPPSARRPEAKLHNMPTCTLKQPLLADPVATQGIAYGFKEGEIKSSVERASSPENHEMEEYKGAGDGESKTSAARFQKRELSHLMRRSEASTGTCDDASSGDKKALHAERENVETRDTQRHASEGEAHTSTSATTRGVVVYVSSGARRSENATHVSPASFESCPQTPAVNAGHNSVSCGVDGRVLKSWSFSRTAEEHEKHPTDPNLVNIRRDGNKRANRDQKEGMQEGETTTDLGQACSAELEEGREEGSSSVICVGTLSVEEHKGELESLTEVAQAGQDGKSSVPTGRSSVESSNEHTEKERDKNWGGCELNGSDTDGEVRLGGTEPCRGPQAGKSNEKTEKIQLAAAVAAAVQLCQSTSFVKDEGTREATTSTTGADCLVSTQGDKNNAEKHSGGAFWKSSASLFSKAAAFEQTPGGDAFASDKDIPAPGVNARVDKRATSALERRTDTCRRDVPDEQKSAELGRSTAIERAASASYTAAGGTELCAAREYAYAKTSLAQRNERDCPTDKAVHVESTSILELEQRAQIYTDSQRCDGTVAELKKGACQRRGLVPPNLKNSPRGTDTERSIRSNKRLAISHNAGGMNVDIFSSQAAGGSPSHSPVGDIPLPGIQNSTQLEIVPYCHVQSRKPEHLHCSILSPSAHLSKCELEAVHSPTVLSKDLPACRAPAVTTCMMQPLSERSSAKLTSTCLGWTSRPSPLSRRPLSVRAVLSPPVEVAEPQSSMLLYSFSDASHEGLSLRRMSAKKPSAHGDVSPLTNYTARSACAASELEVPLVKDTCTGNAPWSELHDKPGREGCGLRSHRDCLLQGTQHLVSKTLPAGRPPEDAQVCSSEKATPQSGTALQANVSVIPVPDTSRIPVGSMLSLAAASPPYCPCTVISPRFYCSTRQRLPRSSAAGSIRAVSALCTSAYKKDSLAGWETKLKIPGDSPSRWASGRIGEVVKSRPSDSVADGSWELERNGEQCHFPPYEAAGDPRGCERVRSCGNIPEVHDAATLTQALQDATSFFDSVDEALLSGFRDKAGSTGSDCVAGRDLCDTSSTSRDSPSVISKGRNEPRPRELSILASQSLTSGHDSVAQAKPNIVIHSRSQLRAFRKACVTAPFKPPAATVSDCALMPVSRFSRQTSTHHMNAKVSFGSGQPPATSCRLLRRSTSHLESPPLSRIPAGKSDVAASSVEVEANAKTVTDQCRQDLTRLLQVAGVAPGDVLEVRLPFPVTDGGNRQSADAVGPKKMIHSKFGPRIASVPVKPPAYVAATHAPWQQIDEGGRRHLYDEPVNVMSFSSSPTCAREDLNVANKSHEASLDTGRNCSGLGTENAPASEAGCWVEAEVILPETREIDQKSCRRIMQLTYKGHPGLSTKVVFLGFHHLLCLSTSLTLNGNETPQPKIRRVGGETKSWFLPFGDGRLLSTMDQKILEFRKPADFLVGEKLYSAKQSGGKHARVSSA